MFWCSGGSQSNEVHWIHLDFLSGYHLHLMPPELVTKIIFVNLCSIQFHHIFISFLLLQISRPSHSSGMLFQSSVLTLPPTILFKIILRHIKFINGCTKQGLCLRNSIVTSPQSNSFLSRSARLSPFSPQLIPISSSFNNYPSVSLDHFTEAQRNTSKELYLSEVYQRKGWVNLWSFIFIAFTHFPFTLNLLFKNCFDKSFMKVLFSPKKVFIYRSVHGVLILHLFGSQLFFFISFYLFLPHWFSEVQNTFIYKSQVPKQTLPTNHHTTQTRKGTCLTGTQAFLPNKMPVSALACYIFSSG